MKWYKPLFIGESIVDKKEKVIKKIQQNVLQPNIYIIVLATNSKDNFRIIPTKELLQKNYPKDDLTVIGIANGKDEAFLLVEKMVQECLSKHIEIDYIHKYYEGRLNNP